MRVVMTVVHVPDWAGIPIGLALLGLVFMERRRAAPVWRNPARRWSPDPEEFLEAGSAAQPLKVVLGETLGLAAFVWGVVSVLS